MTQPNYELLTEAELREYVRFNPQDEDAFQHYLTIVRAKPGRVVTRTEEEFDAELRKRIAQEATQ
ncbi:hypothetical protein PI95_012305 [Hassallia byssoidea VB512170]|uniref:Uncharacterized protein n=1 Tax=Hassallia byssoidea VB512170 TaxID=1304833 RepID=A0A846H6N0_9CYAN|nr:hypothetical protein [Hassalia byssoidea]NEU73327.1 hypothetical protein [Hassalia byssoidea VB512170]